MYLVDLPGYGYAKVFGEGERGMGEDDRALPSWLDTCSRAVFLLIDIRA